MLGIHANKNGDYAAAERFLRAAIERTSAAYTRPKDAQAYYQLGIALRGQHQQEAAYDAFYRASWDRAYHTAAYYQLSELAALRPDFRLASRHVMRALATDRIDTRALCLKAAILRKLNRFAEAEKTARSALSIDPLDFHAANELVLALRGRGQATVAQQERNALTKRMRGDVQAYLELASDYMNAGFWDTAIAVLRRPIELANPRAGDYPLLHYYLGYALRQRGDMTAAEAEYALGARKPSTYCFPFRLEGIDVLNAAIKVNPNDARAYYYMGNLLFDRQPDVAMASWEKSRALDPTLATVHRNLGWAYQHAKHDATRAIACYQQAIACDNHDPRLFLELDQLYQFANATTAQRWAVMQSNHATLVQRQDSFLREIRVLILAGQYDRAIDHLEHHFFHAQEGRRDVHDLFVNAHLLKGLKLLDDADPGEALKHFMRAADYPENLSVGRPANDPQAAQITYYSGLALTALKRDKEARAFYQKAAGTRNLAKHPVAQFCQGMSRKKLGRPDAASEVFAALAAAGKRGLAARESSDFFAKFGTGRSRRVQVASAHLMLGLGLLGQGDAAGANQQFKQAANGNHDDAWAAYFAAQGEQR